MIQARRVAGEPELTRELLLVFVVLVAVTIGADEGTVLGVTCCWVLVAGFEVGRFVRGRRTNCLERRILAMLAKGRVGLWDRRVGRTIIWLK